MSGNVVSLCGEVEPRAGEPSQACIDALRELLERAEAGVVQGIAVACLHGDGGSSYRISGRVGGFTMQGALRCAEVELANINVGFDG